MSMLPHPDEKFYRDKLKMMVFNRLRQLTDLANDDFVFDFKTSTGSMTEPNINFVLTGNSPKATTCPPLRKIHFNIDAMSQDPDEYLDNTVTYCFCRILAYNLFGMELDPKPNVDLLLEHFAIYHESENS